MGGCDSEIRCCCFCACVHDTVKYKQITCENMLQFLEKNILPTPYLYTYLRDHCRRVLRIRDTDTVDGAMCDQDDTVIENFTLCVNCDSWIRRQVSKKNTYLHTDALFLNILFPGRFELPEERSCLRVVHNVCTTNGGVNFLQSIAPVPVQEFFLVFSQKYPVAVVPAQSADDNKQQLEASPEAKKFEHWHMLSSLSVVDASKKHRRHEQRSHIKNKLVYIWWQRNRRCEFLSNKYTAKLLRHIIHGMP